MNVPPALASSEHHFSPRPRRRVTVVARQLVAVIGLLALLLYAARLPSALAQYRADADLAGLRGLGLTPTSWAVYHVVLDVILTLGNAAIAAVLLWRRSADRMAVIVAATLLFTGVAPHIDPQHLPPIPLLAHLLRWFETFLVPALVFAFFYVFPDGRWVPRWSRPPLIALMVVNGIAAFFPGSPIGLDHWPVWLRGLNWMGSWAAGLSAQIYRYLRVSDRVQRQQTKWVVYGLAVAILGSVAVVSLAVPFPGLNQPGRLAILAILAGRPIFAVLQLLVPLSIAVSVLRYRLWDVDILINRTLVYVALTASVVGVYVLLVGGLGALLQTRGNLLLSLVATGLIAVIFQPLRVRLQRGANRLLYGERDDPYAAIARLGGRLEAILVPEAVLPAIVETVRESLKLPYAAIVLVGDERPTTDHGPPTTDDGQPTTGY